MAKTNGKSPISSEKTEWGMKLKIHPFDGITGSKVGGMVISADVERPKPGRRPEIRIWFSGVVGGASLSLTENGIWMNSMRGLLEEAARVGAAMKPKTTRTRAKVGAR